MYNVVYPSTFSKSQAGGFILGIPCFSKTTFFCLIGSSLHSFQILFELRNVTSFQLGLNQELHWGLDSTQCEDDFALLVWPSGEIFFLQIRSVEKVLSTCETKMPGPSEDVNETPVKNNNWSVDVSRGEIQGLEL